MGYFYAPIAIIEPEGSRTPGMPNEDGDLIESPTPPGTTSPLCDESESRFVLICPDGAEVPDSWTEKTASEVETDYPGLLGGG